jgi:hypothetical protein
MAPFFSSRHRAGVDAVVHGALELGMAPSSRHRAGVDAAVTE